MIYTAENHAILRMADQNPDFRSAYRTFQYDPSSQKFLINGQPFSEEEACDMQSIDEEKLLDDEEIINTPVLLDGFGNPLGGVVLDRWVKLNRTEQEGSQLSQSVISVMYSVYTREYKKVQGYDLDPDDSDLENSFDHTGFRFLLRPDVFAGVDFQVLGNACDLGNGFPARYEGKSYQNVFSYEFHNVDSSFQELSLYAGLGYVAYLASKEKVDTQ